MVRLARIIFVAAVMFTLVMALTPNSLGSSGQHADKVQHMLAFFTLAVLGRLALPRASFAVLFAALGALGALIELVQLVPVLGRDGDMADWLADMVASAAGLLFAAAVQRLFASRWR